MDNSADGDCIENKYGLEEWIIALMVYRQTFKVRAGGVC